MGGGGVGGGSSANRLRGGASRILYREPVEAAGRLLGWHRHREKVNAANACGGAGMDGMDGVAGMYTQTGSATI